MIFPFYELQYVMSVMSHMLDFDFERNILHPVRKTGKKIRTLLWLSQFKFQDQLELQRKATVSEASKLIIAWSCIKHAWLFEDTREMQCFLDLCRILNFKVAFNYYNFLTSSVRYSLVAITASLYTLVGLIQVQCVDCLRNSTRP